MLRMSKVYRTIDRTSTFAQTPVYHPFMSLISFHISHSFFTSQHVSHIHHLAESFYVATYECGVSLPRAHRWLGRSTKDFQEGYQFPIVRRGTNGADTRQVLVHVFKAVSSGSERSTIHNKICHNIHSLPCSCFSTIVFSMEEAKTHVMWGSPGD